MRLYSSNDADEARREGERDAHYGRRNYDYDRCSEKEKDRAYFEGFRHAERLVEERQQEMDEQRRAHRRYEEQQMEEQAMMEQQAQSEMEAAQTTEEQNQEPETPPAESSQKG
jgi:hypothetical protein